MPSTFSSPEFSRNGANENVGEHTPQSLPAHLPELAPEAQGALEVLLTAGRIIRNKLAREIGPHRGAQRKLKNISSTHMPGRRSGFRMPSTVHAESFARQAPAQVRLGRKGIVRDLSSTLVDLSQAYEDILLGKEVSLDTSKAIEAARQERIWGALSKTFFPEMKAEDSRAHFFHSLNELLAGTSLA